MRRPTNNTPPAAPADEPPSTSGLVTIRRILPYLWPDGEAWVKRRVVIALLMLVAAKIVSVSTPFFYKAAVDGLAGDAPDGAMLMGLTAVALTVAYGLARLGAVAFGELRDAVFVRVGQRALRKLALETFTHIHRLSLRYHITRKTGGLSRIIERGVKGVDFLLRFMLFSIGPL
ncbi:MAG: ABC transporter transmembrane domain-containing protein, partial [Gemmobacter sp.]